MRSLEPDNTCLTCVGRNIPRCMMVSMDLNVFGSSILNGRVIISDVVFSASDVEKFTTEQFVSMARASG